MSSNLSVPLAERVFFLLGGWGGGGALQSTAQLVKTLSSTSCQNIIMYNMHKIISELM